MKRFNIRRIITIVAVLIVVWFLFIQNGGDTITILNRSAEDICEVYFAFSPDESGWGRNRILSVIKKTHSRDIRLPIFFEWTANSPGNGYSGKAVDCNGSEIMRLDGIGIDTNFFIWEVR